LYAYRKKRFWVSPIFEFAVITNLYSYVYRIIQE